MLSRICKISGSSFEISDADLAYYEKIQVPLPTLSPKERLKRRLAFRNERTLYKRKCDKSGREMISNLGPDAKVPVFHTEEWYKDDWEAPAADYDPARSFFDQFHELAKISPHMHKADGGNSENSEYINHAGNCRNCYYIFNTEYAEDCMYLRFADHVTDCVDCTNTIKSELCYECVNVEDCYNLRYCDDCKNCKDSYFLRFCRGCSNCLFCYGLEQKQYHIFNQPHTKEDFEKKLAELKLQTYSGQQNAFRQWHEWAKQFPLIRAVLLNCENCTGNSLYNCKNALDCYNCAEVEDSRYILNAVKVKDSYDVYAYGEIELGYEYVTSFKSYDVKFSSYVINCQNMEYCDTCYNSNNCFGCVGLNKKSYCVFNKQYGKEEYEKLVKKIKEQMTKDQEYGEFFPIYLSPYPYEDTLANDYFRQFSKEKNPPEGESEPVASIPDDASLIDLNAIQQKTFLCPVTEKAFKFQKKELEFYKKMALPLPHESFEARYQRRNKLIPFPY